MKFPSRHIFFMRFISLGGKKGGKRTFVKRSFDARSMMGGEGGRMKDRMQMEGCQFRTILSRFFHG